MRIGDAALFHITLTTLYTKYTPPVKHLVVDVTDDVRLARVQLRVLRMRNRKLQSRRNRNRKQLIAAASNHRLEDRPRRRRGRRGK